MAAVVTWKNFGFYNFIGLCLIYFVTAASPASPASSPLYTFSGTRGEIMARERNIHKINLSVPVVYGTRLYNSFIISRDGFISFSKDESTATYHSKKWYEDDVDSVYDVPFIAPYYFDGHDIDQNSQGHIFYQDLTLDNGHRDDLADLGRYIKQYVVGSDMFDPRLGVLVTWTNMTSRSMVKQGSCDGTVQRPCSSNTFQLLLVTDGSLSYAVFNYGSLQLRRETFDQAGFNVGHGGGWTNVLTDPTDLDQLIQFGNGAVHGRYIFKISGPQIVRGGCVTDPGQLHLSVYPDHADMFGGRMIDISGPCFRRDQKVLCSFGKPTDVNIQPYSEAVYVSESRARCFVPRLFVRDRISLLVSVNGGRTYAYNAPFTIVLPGRVSSKQHLGLTHTLTEWGWYGLNQKSLEVTWDPHLLSNNSNDQANINLIGYREDKGEPEFKLLATIGSNVRVMSGSYTIQPQDFRCKGDDCFDFEQGQLEVRLNQDSTPQQFKYLASKVMPLGWYVEDAMKQRHGSEWPSALCLNWYNRDRQSTSWLQSQPSCPCNLVQALTDFGRWQPDEGCSLLSKSSSNCFYHRGAAHCVRAVQPREGAGNQCCYTSAGTLMFAADTFQGSTPDRSHDWGAAPYGRPGYVPSLSHWLVDVVTFYYCCLWTEDRDCDYYMDLRATRDCNEYVPPGIGSVFGQGHVITYGGLRYRILGPGDYVLAAAGSTVIQGRFERNPFPTTEDGRHIQTSYTLTSVAVKDILTSDKVELSLSPEEANWSYKRIDVWVNKQLVTFDTLEQRWQDFTGLAVVDTDYKNKRQSNFTVMLTNGIGFQVAEVDGTLQMDLMMPANTFINVSGLFGDLSGNIQFTNGSLVDVDTTLANPWNLFNDLELNWAVRDRSRSLFRVHQAANDTQVHFEIDPTSQPSTGEARARCGSVKECLFDFQHTGSRSLATETWLAVERRAYLDTSLTPVRSCGLLNVPRSIKSSGDYVLGTKTSITGCRVGALSGSTTYTCTETSNITQEWFPTVDASCTSEEPEDANVGMIVGVVVAIVVLLLAAIVVAVFAVRRKKSRRPKKTTQRPDTPSDAFDPKSNEICL